MNQQQVSDPAGAREYRDYRDDEIDLMELFAVLWRGKWAIMAYVVISAAIAVAYIALSPAKYKGSLEIKPLLASDMLSYQDMNNQKMVTISPGALLGRFVTDLESRESLIEAFKQSSVLEVMAQTSDDPQDELAIEMAYDIAFVPPTDPEEQKKGNKKRYWTLEFETTDPDEFKEIVLAASVMSTQAVHQFYLDKVEHTLEFESVQVKRTKEDIETSIALKLKAYDESTEHRLEFLKEQATLARTLGLAKNAVEAQSFASTDSVIVSLESKAPFYMRGYKAIEKEAELLTAREDKSLHIKELLGLNEDLRRIEAEASRKIERLKEGVEVSPLSTGEFKAVRFDLNSIDFKSSKRAALILVLSVIMGGMVGVFAVFVQAGMRSYKARQAC